VSGREEKVSKRCQEPFTQVKKRCQGEEKEEKVSGTFYDGKRFLTPFLHLPRLRNACEAVRAEWRGRQAILVEELADRMIRPTATTVSPTISASLTL
jgi:hypothetical protein